MIAALLVLAALGAMWGAVALLLGPHRWVVAGSPRAAQAARPRTKTPKRVDGRPDAAREEEHDDEDDEGEGGPVSREGQDWSEVDRLVGEAVQEAAARLGETAPEKSTEKGEGDDD